MRISEVSGPSFFSFVYDCHINYSLQVLAPLHFYLWKGNPTLSNSREEVNGPLPTSVRPFIAHPFTLGRSYVHV